MRKLLEHDYRFIFSDKRIVGLLVLLSFLLLRFGETRALLNTSLIMTLIVCASSNQISGILLNSLANNKREVVAARYVFMGLSSLLIVIAYLLMGLVVNPSEYGIYYSSLKHIVAFYYSIIIFSAMLLFISFMLTRTGAVVGMLVVYWFPNAFMYSMYLAMVKNMLIASILLIIWLACSFYMSLSVYKEREFA